MGKKVRNLAVRSVTGVLFVVIMVTGMLDPYGMSLLFALVTGLSVWEYTGLVNAHAGVSVNRVVSTAAAVCLFFVSAAAMGGLPLVHRLAMFYVVTLLYLMVSELYSRPANAVDNMAYTMLPQLYIALPLSMVNVLAYTTGPDGGVAFSGLLPLSVFVFLWVNDSGAYCTGSLIGRRKLFPSVSPGKTWEGSIGGAALTLAAAAALWAWDGKGPGTTGLALWQWMGLGLTVAVAGTWGDLVESLFKRTLGVKDSGNILPGHGGMLDRFDSSLFAIPAAAAYLYFLQA